MGWHPTSSAVAVAPLVAQVGWRSGRYYFVPPSSSPSSSALSKENERAAPFYVPNSVTLSRIGGSLTSPGDVGSKVRLGLRNDDGTGRPGSLLLDAGVIAGDSSSTQEITIAQPVLAGAQLWSTATSQVITTTAPTVVCVTTTIVAALDQGTATPTTVNQVTACRFQSGVTGALPTTWTDAGVTIAMQRIFVKVA